jgi:hypothetical protein
MIGYCGAKLPGRRGSARIPVERREGEISPTLKSHTLTLFIFLVVLDPLIAWSTGAYELRGTVRDAVTGEPLASANVRVAASSRGTIANVNGRFVLPLDPGTHRVIISSIGYRPDTLLIDLTGSLVRDVMLQPSEILLPEIVVTSEDPAIEIIRRAIANKKRWADRLSSYELQAFTRQTIRRDTAIAAINESYTRGYWQKGDTLREIVRQKRQTANIGAEQNFASVGRILNFNEDRIRFVGYSFVGPTATDALEYYDYKLLRTRAANGAETYEIRMIPRTRSIPLFAGTVNIAGESYALIGVDVEPNEAFLIPFIKDRKLRYRQQFSLYDHQFWMPADIRIEGAFTIGLVGLTMPRIAIEQTSVIYQYDINTPIPDSIIQKPRLSVDSTARRYDSTFWATTAVLPLNVQEQKAYATLDSTQSLEVQFRPGGVAATLGGGGEGLGSFLEILDISFNRVEGLHLGARYTLDGKIPWLSAKGGFAYGFSDMQTKYLLGMTVYPGSRRAFGVGAEIYRRLDHRPDQGYFEAVFNSLTCLISRNDYRDYYQSEGGRAFIVGIPTPKLRMDFSFVAEQHRSAEQNTDFSFFSHSRSYRPNPPVVEGNLRSLRLDLRLGDEPVPLDLISRDQVVISIEHSNPSLASSSFSFTRYDAVGIVTFPTFAEDFLFRPSLKVRVGAGTATGDVPPQRWFDLESSSSGVGPFGVMRAMSVKEFSGTGYLAINLEHNFRTIPFLLLGVPFLYENGIEFLVHGGGARTWSHNVPVPHTTDGWYAEAGFGISRILDLLRVDFTWRLSQPYRFALTVAVAGIL